jgi:hypothetical protein
MACNAWVSHAAAMVAPLETRMAGAMAITPSKCWGKRWVNIIPWRPPPEQPMK